MAWRRPAKLVAFWGVAVSLIVVAVLVGLIQLALPWWASDADRVARLLSSRLGTPVSIEQALPEWSPRGPLIELRGVRFGAAGDIRAARIDRAAWAIDFSGLLRPGRRFSEFRLHGVDITLQRGADGRWQVRGLPELLRGESTQPLGRVLRDLPAFALRDSRLTLREVDGNALLTMALPELGRVDAADLGAMRWRGRLAPGAGRAPAASGDAGQLLFALDIDSDDAGRVYLAGDSLALAGWLGASRPLGLKPLDASLSLQAWLAFDATGVRDVQFEVRQAQSTWARPGESATLAGAVVDAGHVDDARLAVTDSTTVLPPLAIGGRWQVDGDTSLVLIDRFTAAGEPAGRVHGLGNAGRLQLHAADVDLSLLGSLATLTTLTSDPLRRWLADARPAGRIAAADIRFQDRGFRQAALRVEDLQSAASGPVPGVAGLSARARADGDGLVVWPDGDAVVLDYPGVFAQPLSIGLAGGAIALWRSGTGWALEMDRLALRGDDYSAQVGGGIGVTSGQPIQLDLGISIDDTAIEAVKPFWPINRIPNTARWLNRALKGGRVARGHAWIRGPATGFPFNDHSGRVDAVVDVVDAGLDYRDEWPPLTDANATLSFENASMRVQGESLRIAGVAVTGAGAEVPDMKAPILSVQASSRVAGEDLFDLIRQTPLQARFGAYLQGMRIEGSPLATVDLRFPLKRELGESTVDGRLSFAGEDYFDAQRELAFGALDGDLRFTRNSVSAEAMKLELDGEPARLDLRIGASTQTDGAALEAELTGRLSANALFGNIDVLSPVLAAAEGRADWRVDVAIPQVDAGLAARSPADPAAGDADADARTGRILVESDLAGIELALPAPLAKDRDGALPLRLETQTRSEGRRIDLRLGQLLHLDARLAAPGRAFAGAIALGGAAQEQLPERGLVVTGQVPALDLSGWLALDDSDAPVDPQARIDWPRVILRAGELGVLGRGFRDVDLQMEPGTDGVEVRLIGPDIEGTIAWPNASAGRVVRGRFVRVHVPSATSGELGSSLAPSAIPALDIETDDLRVGVSRLGRTRLVAQALDGAYRIDTFQSRSAAFELDASGSWQRRDGRDESDMDIELRADDLGAMLESFGFAGLIEGGRTVATIDGRWAGSPAAFALERIDGTLDVDVEAGRILEVDPGVGRLFGLLNLREIPRRLILDFRDFFSQGMRFNSIQGRFALNVGEAYTDDMMLKSPSADILITGRTGLIMRDYDQTLEVSPRLGGTLPVVGAIAGGPAGAAAGLVVQGLLRIDQAAKIVYRVTGPWDEPVIIKQEPATSSARRERLDNSVTEPAT